MAEHARALAMTFFNAKTIDGGTALRLKATTGLSGLSRRILAIGLRSSRSLTAAVFNPYHPELHYMRGPGPRWRDKHPAHS